MIWWGGKDWPATAGWLARCANQKQAPPLGAPVRAGVLARGVQAGVQPHSATSAHTFGCNLDKQEQRPGRGWKGTGTGVEEEARGRRGAGEAVRVFSGPAPLSLWESGYTWGRCNSHQCCLPRGICMKWAQQGPDAQRPQSRRGRVGRTMAKRVHFLFWVRRERSRWK